MEEKWKVMDTQIIYTVDDAVIQLPITQIGETQVRFVLAGLPVPDEERVMRWLEEDAEWQAKGATENYIDLIIACMLNKIRSN